MFKIFALLFSAALILLPAYGLKAEPPLHCVSTTEQIKKQHSEGNYFLTVVAIFKREHYAIREWVQHYIYEGVDHFILIDNNAAPAPHERNESCTLGTYIEAGVMTLIKSTAVHAQAQLINTHLHPFLQRTKWVLHVDLDEYMYARTPHSSPESYTSIAKWLSSLPARVQVISTPWKMFSHAGSAQPGGIVNSIRHRSAAKDDNSKWLVRGAAVRGYSIHYPIVIGVHSRRGGYTPPPPTSGSVDDTCIWILPDYSCQHNRGRGATGTSNDKMHIHLNHYPVQSREMFGTTKMARGSANIRKFDNVRNWNYYHTKVENPTVYDPELALKRFNNYNADQERMDDLICKHEHAGGQVPIWCFAGAKKKRMEGLRVE